jgi:excisionase family DNA binding protein
MALKKIDSLKDYPGAFITTTQAADYLNMSAKAIRAQIEKGALPARKFGDEYRILISDFQLYVGSTSSDKTIR